MSKPQATEDDPFDHNPVPPRRSFEVKLASIQQIERIERDAARYRWLKETFFDETFPGLYDSPIGGGVTGEQFDADIDAEMAKESARA